MKKLILTTIFALTFAHLFAQSEASVWYFGRGAGLDFSGPEVKVLTDSRMNTLEGCATFCDSKGKLLLYTDGISVRNNAHEVMQNGKNLAGNPSSTQSAVVLPRPGSRTEYFLFTIDKEGGPDGFRYSIVEPASNGGKGRVTRKNVLLMSPVTEKITAVKHRNNIDYWVITHGLKNDNFVAYLLTAKGVSAEAVVSKIGTVHKDSKGYMKASPDGTNIAVAVESQNLIELFDFDNGTGKVSRPLTILMPEAQSYPYGLEFSPTGSRLYAAAGGRGKIYRYNLQSRSDREIMASEEVVAQVEVKRDNSAWIGALQAAIDGKIYVAHFNVGYMSVIENPDEDDCGFKAQAIDLQGKIGQLGIPTFTQDLFSKKEFDNAEVVFAGETVLGKAFVLEHVFFETGKADLRTESFPELDNLVKMLNESAGLKIVLAGHTDNIGNKAANLKLSEKRADSVRKYLISKKINSERIIAKGFGSSRGIADNSSPEGRQKNRRVTFELKE